MVLTSFVFLIFCVITIFIYYIVPKKLQWCILLISSIIFLFWNNFSISTVIQALIVLIPTYILGRLIDKNYNTEKAKKFLILGILIILAQLIYLKYTNLFLTTANHIFNLFNIEYKFNLIYRNSLIGISYYSLIMISYLVDIYRGTCKAQKNILKCALFMSYFPILTSGPFVRYDNMENQLYEKHKFNYKNLCNGLIRILWGMFKILVISERLGMIVNSIYGNLNEFNFIFIFMAAILFPIQLYTNFSGSIDVIMGTSEIIGIKLPENFSLPFFSRTLAEFWRNWHITLGAWLRDYIFYPLQKSNVMQNLNKKCKNIFGKKIARKISMYLSMIIMWTLIGIWHGGAYTYIIGSGLLQFLFIFLEDILGPTSKKINNKLGINTEVFSYKLYQVIRTYLLFSFAMIFFKANSVTNAIDIIRGIFTISFSSLFSKERIYAMINNIGLDMFDFIILVVALIVLFGIQLLARKGKIREKLFNQNIVFRWVVIYTLIFGVIIFGCYGAGYNPTAFIYRQF